LIPTLLNNLFGYDSIILLLALVNGFVVFPRVQDLSRELHDHLQPKVYVPIRLLIERVKGQDEKPLDLSALSTLRARETQWYSLFTTLLGAFPLLGMLGTVLSLLGMATLSPDLIVARFTTALTSTFWGLFFALVFKGLDAAVYPLVEQNRESLKMLLERVDQHGVTIHEAE
jgi:chemotaxis protein MotA